MNRSFTIIDYPNKGQTYGRYISKNPKRAAHKAFSRLSRIINLKNSNNKNLLIFSLKETTFGRKNNKKYKYVGMRVELNTPIIIKYNDNGKYKEIEHRYKNIIVPYEKFYR